MSKYTAKTFLLPGASIEATDEDGKTFEGVVQQSNPDGAMICQLKGLPLSEFVWAPAPKPEKLAAAAVAPVPAVKESKKVADLQAEVKQLQGLVQEQGGKIADQEQVIAALNAQLAAASAPAGSPVVAPAAEGSTTAPAETEEDNHFGKP